MSLKEKLFLLWFRSQVKKWRQDMKLKRLWLALDGWKLVIGVTLIFGSRVWDAMHNGHTGDFIGSILTALNWMPSGDWTGPAMTAAAGGTVALVGIVMKLVKATQQLRAGASAAGLLTTEGYVKQAVSAGMVQQIRGVYSAQQRFVEISPEQVGFVARLLYGILKVVLGGHIKIGQVDIPLPTQTNTVPTGSLGQPHDPGFPDNLR